MDLGAVGDGTTLNTAKIQAAIDQLASAQGGTLVIPKGTFLCGAIFIKPGVNLRLDAGAVLKGSADIRDYPAMNTRVEGHFEKWIPALVNADKVDHLRITGSGTIDGNGLGFYTAFWDARKRDPKVTNLTVPRPRIALIENADDVQISGITFKDSGFWNLHLYRCKHVLVENDRFQVPDGMRCPSTDGTDIDSCQDVTIRGCSYRVDDDCVCLKGSKGPFAQADADSPPVEHIRVENCTFERGNGALTLGSEATVVRDVVVENCKLAGPVNLAVVKLRPDTPQDYEDVHYRRITLEAGARAIINMAPWKQFFDLKGQAPPKSTVRNLTLADIKGTCGSFGIIQGNAGQTDISDVTLSDIDVQVKNPSLKTGDVTNLKIENVMVNGSPFSLPTATKQ